MACSSRSLSRTWQVGCWSRRAAARHRRWPWPTAGSTRWSGIAPALRGYISISAWSRASACCPASGSARASRSIRAAYALLACRPACCAVRRCAAWSRPREQFVQLRRPVVLHGLRGRGLIFRAGLRAARHPARVRMTGSARVRAVAARAPRRRWRPGAGGRWRALRPGDLLRTRATIRPSSAVGRRAGPGFLPPAGRARGVGVRPWLFRPFPWCRGCRRTSSRTGRYRLRGAAAQRPAARRGPWRWPRRLRPAGLGRLRIAAGRRLRPAR